MSATLSGASDVPTQEQAFDRPPGTRLSRKCENDQRRSPPSSRRGGRLRVEECHVLLGSPSSSRVFARAARRPDLRARGGFGIKTLAACYTRETPRCTRAGRQRRRAAVSHFRFPCVAIPGAAPSRRARSGRSLVAPRAMAVHAVALFDRAGAVDGALRRASKRWIGVPTGASPVTRAVDSSAATGLNGRMKRSGDAAVARVPPPVAGWTAWTIDPGTAVKCASTRSTRLAHFESGRSLGAPRPR